MKTKNIAVKAVVLLGALLMGALLAANLLIDNSRLEDRISASAGQPIFLAKPAFAQDAESRAATSEIEDEAGMSAYFKAATGIDLGDVRDLFRTIETETADYIIGSVPVDDYPETEDVHVYVHTDGWILAYYLSEDPGAKIFDWRAYHYGGRMTITTKLENVLAIVAAEAGAPFYSATYYDFRHPNATHLMLIVEVAYDGYDSCEVKLPGSIGYYERSWSLGCEDYGHYYLDGEAIATSYDWAEYGTLTAAQLLPDEFHTIEVYASGYDYAYGGLALIYEVP